MGDHKVRKPTKPHWYKWYLGECPVCGRDQSYRVRVYGKKPKSAKQRYVYLPDYACCSHF
jgi:hypothetical protein